MKKIHEEFVRRFGPAFALCMAVATAVASFAAWLTHIFVCFKTASWMFLIAGAIFFPVAVIHGVGIWFSAW